MTSTYNTGSKFAAALLGSLALVSTFCMTQAVAKDLVAFNGVTAQGGPTAQMFPIFMAQKMGFYAAEGLEVKLKYSKGSSDAARQLAVGKAEWGIFSSAATMQTVQRGSPLKAIMQVYYPDTFDIVVPTTSKVQTMADMKGLSIGVSDLTGGEVPMTMASIFATGLKVGSDVKLVVAGDADPLTVRALNEGRIQAYAGAKRDLLLLPAQGIPVRSITPKVITQFPGDALVVRLETYKAKPELLVKFVRATLKGREWGMANSDKAFDLLKTEYATSSLKNNPVAGEFWTLVKTYYTAPTEVSSHGTFLPQGWKTYMGYLQQGEGAQRVLPSPVDLETLLTNDIVLKAAAKQ